MQENAFDRICDTIDIETFFICHSEEEAKELSYQLAVQMNLGSIDIVFLEHKGIGARVRLRYYAHHPGDQYRWLETEGIKR